MALGALIIKERLGTSDRETVEQIRENPYLQYFLGSSEYSNTAPFDASMFVHFRKRLDLDVILRVNEAVVRGLLVKETAVPASDSEGNSGGKEEPAQAEAPPEVWNANQGQLILDATCAPADIRDSRDLDLLNEARVYSERIIDDLYDQLKRMF